MVGGVCGQLLSVGGRQLLSLVGGHHSWVGDGGHRWWCCHSLLWGHGRSLSGKQLSTWNALMGVPHQQFGGGTICWVPSPLPSPLLMSVIIVGIVGMVVIVWSVSRCVVVVVSDGGGDS